MNDEPFNQLEKTLHATLRGQPVLRAPSTLEQRVRAEIARRDARPWWQRTFAEWPVLPRAAFVALSGCAACISIAGTLAVLNGPGAEMAAAFLRDFSVLRGMAQSVVASGVQKLGTLSPGWWYLAGGVMAAAYAGLLGLGATAYRLLWKGR
jgi:hypothetical protein